MNRFLLYQVLSSFLLVSCQKILFDEDEIAREIRPGDFSSIDVRGVFDILLIQDSADRIELKGKKDIRTIDVGIESGILKISDPVNMSFNTKRNNLIIHFRSIENLTLWNPVTINNTDTLRLNMFILAAIAEVVEVNLKVNCNGLIVSSANSLGHFNLIGKADYLFMESWYGCSFLADRLSCRQAEIVHESIGDVYVNASETITAFIRGPGNIYYRGNPEIRIAEKKGDGKLIHLN